ncbi:hypothetical protein QN277_007409 [Acacia crassicarpa]|uniref:Uncharacterized protein n=1 Tax=Acacia crassicarpa TaxID=499986 RepID=A0AAE1IWY8_9FABA|nr:hypothetical protein QN277_007409 [Acacia crassicarpa]
MEFTIVEINFGLLNQRCFMVTFDGTGIFITVTHTADVVEHWITMANTLRGEFPGRFPVGLGVQWTPGDGDPPADTLQLCVDSQCLVYQLSNSPRVPDSLQEFLMNPGNIFVGLWNHRDRWKLSISGHRLRMLRDPLDMANYVEEYLGIPGVPISQKICMSVWRDEYLNYEQVLQVTLDAHFAFVIGGDIRAWEFNLVGP